MFSIEYCYRSDAGMSSTYAPSLVSLGITPIKSEVGPTAEAKSEKLNSNGELDLEGNVSFFFFDSWSFSN